MIGLMHDAYLLHVITSVNPLTAVCFILDLMDTWVSCPMTGCSRAGVLGRNHADAVVAASVVNSQSGYWKCSIPLSFVRLCSGWHQHIPQLIVNAVPLHAVRL